MSTYLFFRVSVRTWPDAPVRRPGVWHCGSRTRLKPNSRRAGGDGFMAICGHSWPATETEVWDRALSMENACPRCVAGWNNGHYEMDPSMTAARGRLS